MDRAREGNEFRKKNSLTQPKLDFTNRTISQGKYFIIKYTHNIAITY